MDKSLCDIFPGTQARPQPNKYVLTIKTFVSLWIAEGWFNATTFSPFFTRPLFFFSNWHIE